MNLNQADKSFNPNPSEVTDVFWIIAKRKEGEYPRPTVNSGKWLVFVDLDNIDNVWKKVRQATESGLLGHASKVATNKPNPNAWNSQTKVICIYTYDYTDKNDVMRIREEIRKIGIEKKIPYKPDKATRENKYSKNGDKGTSIYFE